MIITGNWYNNKMKHFLFKKQTVFLYGLFIILIASPSYQQDEDTQKKINTVIDKGVQFILKKGLKGRDLELEVLTLLQAGVEPKKNQELAQALNKLNTSNLTSVYNTALTAMALELADRYHYQYRIAECAQALVDAQCANGQWTYGCRYDKNNKNSAPKVLTGKPELIEVITGLSSPSSKPTISVEAKQKEPDKPLKHLEVKRNIEPKKRIPAGDNSNTQFALLGLRAAARSGVTIPKETWQEASDWLVKNQVGDGGWSYGSEQQEARSSYGSMTAAGLCGLAIAKFYLKQDIKNDPAIQKGLNWLAARLVFDANPEMADAFTRDTGESGEGWRHFYQYYYIYGVERVGAVLDLKNIGNHDWYAEGAQYLMTVQNPKNGSWNSTEDDKMIPDIPDTCFALLFLSRATPILKAAQSADNEKKKGD